MSTGGGTSTQTTTQELSPEQRALIKPVIPVAQGMINQPPVMYPGSGITGFNPLQQAAQGMTVQAAQNMLPFTQALPQQLQGLLGGWGSTVNAAGQQGQAGQQQLGNILGATAGSAAQINPLVQQQTGGIMQAVGGAINQGQRAMQPGLNFLTGGAAMSPDTNPFLKQAIMGAARPAIENFQNVIMPGITQEGVVSGGFGGTRQGIAEGLAAQGLNRTIGDISANMGNQAYGQGLQAMTQGLGIQQQAANATLQGILGAGGLQQSGTLGAAGLQQDALGRLIQGNLGGQQAANQFLGTQQQGLTGAQGVLGQTGNIMQQGLLPAQLTEAVGTQQQAMEQARLTEQVQRFVNQQMMPFAIAQDVAAMAFGMPGGTTKTTATGGGNPMGGLQTGIGAISALAPMLAKSDRKLKENVRKVGKLYDGLCVYVFKLKDECMERVGLMADEVIKKYPLAVIDNGEYLLVRYDLVPSWHMRARRY
jgi:hypothetical protein